LGDCPCVLRDDPRHGGGPRRARKRLRRRPASGLNRKAVHPLVLLTLASLLALLFGIAANVLAKSRAPSEAERRAGRGVAGLKHLLQAGEWRAAAPALLITLGLLGVMVFGALTLAVV